MSKWMPPKPIFGHFDENSDCFIYESEFNVWPDDEDLLITKYEFKNWYNMHIRPLFENAVEVYGTEIGSLWSVDYPDYAINQSHKALLINIQPIKEESAEDLLREFVSALGPEGPMLRDIAVKAKAFLERKNKNK